MPARNYSESVFALLDKLDKELNEKCPEVFDVNQIQSIKSEDFFDTLNPQSITIEGNLTAESAQEYATTKQLLHMVLRKFQKKFRFTYQLQSSKLQINTTKMRKKVYVELQKQNLMY